MARGNKIEWGDITRVVNFIRVNASAAPISIDDIYAVTPKSLLLYNSIDIVLRALVDIKIVEESYEGRRQFLWLEETK